MLVGNESLPIAARWPLAGVYLIQPDSVQLFERLSDNQKGYWRSNPRLIQQLRDTLQIKQNNDGGHLL